MLDVDITEGLGFIMSTKSFSSYELVFFEEYESKQYKDKTVRGLMALSFVKFA